ncbi:hypothetical protein E6C76_19820 [Pseudothauera nasutitermitis]|uniref:Lipoprotein n=1 Tax=Pseudothauera nasutitermitis TaxID=2565930 RepID=A0A4S4AQ91_9RHOO|nr:hypothetical protein [Pseudothauera nasutitermitis]THF61906.1 hypothetical protein E6C76_19820 [Pseudothauera nasutitermitis]
MPKLLSRLLLLAAIPLLVACENSATAFMVEGSQHAVILVREQAYFWSEEIDQAVVVSRLPHCQRRVGIHPGGVELAEVDVYEAGDLLWALRQGQHWYLASTERCLVQDWAHDGPPPGALVGTFRLRDGKPAFVPAGG